MNKSATALYEKNVLQITGQVKYSEANEEFHRFHGNFERSSNHYN